MPLSGPGNGRPPPATLPEPRFPISTTQHQTLYRKYRPRLLSEVVGQHLPVRTLRNALVRGDLAHAYLFHGPRGTGKTSLARIFARSLNCEEGLGPEPCGKCANCVDILAERNPEVVEMDAASHSKVEEVRRLLEQLWVPRTRNRYKVYILDEVHMLSTSAFNALLKAVEEPPPGLVFVLCTTEPHKVPATIRSRCQEFAFARVAPADMSPALMAISGKEDFTVEEGVLEELCLASDGCMRDALSLLQQVASTGEGTLSVESLRHLTGRMGEEELAELVTLFQAADGQELLTRMRAVYLSGRSLRALVREVRRHLSERILSGQDPKPLAPLIRWIDQLDHRLSLDQDPLLAVETALARWVADQLAPAEVAPAPVAVAAPAAAAPAPVPSAAAPTAEAPPQQEEEDDDGPRRPSRLRRPSRMMPRFEGSGPTPAQVRDAAPPVSAPPQKPPATPATPTTVPHASREWNDFLHALMAQDVPLLAMLFNSRGDLAGEDLTVRVPARWRVDVLRDQGKMGDLEASIREHFGKPLRVSFAVDGEEGPVAAEQEQTLPGMEDDTAPPQRRPKPRPMAADDGSPVDDGVIGRIMKLAPGSTIEAPKGRTP